MEAKIFMSCGIGADFYKAAVAYCGGDCYGGELCGYAAEEYDGLLLCGGEDVHPRYYGEEMAGTEKVNNARDVYEMALLEKFVRLGKPVFGICRGHQVINIYFGGTLIQDLPTRALHTDGNDIPHTVVSVGDGIVSSLYGERFVVNSSHHQAIKVPGKGLRVTQYSEEDHIIEAIEHESLPIFGVQWHPERMSLQKRRPDTIDGLPLIQYFVNLCQNQ